MANPSQSNNHWSFPQSSLSHNSKLFQDGESEGKSCLVLPSFRKTRAAGFWGRARRKSSDVKNQGGRNENFLKSQSEDHLLLNSGFPSLKRPQSKLLSAGLNTTWQSKVPAAKQHPHQRTRGIYEGEMEPEGVRGQEAPVSSTPRQQLPLGDGLTSKLSRLQIVPPMEQAVYGDLQNQDEDFSQQKQQSLSRQRTDNDEVTQIHQNFGGAQSSRLQQPSPSRLKLAPPRKPISRQVPAENTYSNSIQRSSSAGGRTATTAASSTSRGLQDNDHIKMLQETAMQLVQSGNYEPAVEAFSQVLHIQLSAHGKNHPATASAYHNLGTIHAKRSNTAVPDSIFQQQSRAAALECFQAAARSARDSSLGPNHPNVAVSLVRVGFCLLQAKSYRPALITFDEALRIRQEHYGDFHSLVANVHNNMGICSMHLGEFEHGRESLEQALMIQRGLVDNDTEEDMASKLLELSDTLFNVGGLCMEWIRKQGPDARRAVEAEQAFGEALQIRKTVLGERDPMVIQVQNMLATAQSIPRPRTPQRMFQGSQWVPPHAHDEMKEQEELPDLAISPIQTNKVSESIFRSKAPVRSGRRTMPPLEISVSKEQEANNLDRLSDVRAVRSFEKTHRDFGSPVEALDRSDAAMGKDESIEQDTFILDASDEQMHRSIVNGEESCLISESGIESEHGKIHYPLAWEKANLQNQSSRRDFVVSRPDKTAKPMLSTQNISNSSRQPNSFSTGNKERDNVMARARAIISAHGPGDMPEDEADENNYGRATENPMIDNEPAEDGLAPLGGDWARKGESQPSRKPSVHKMLSDPTTYLGDIHDEAARLLQANEFLDAQRLFEVVLECQRHRCGLLHPDVAAALHNIGITHLRASNHREALKAFEESARIRKGSLGKDHPLVAVSLVKVGVTLLLLRQFDEALWGFREALQVRKHALGALHPSTARIYNNIGCVYVEFNEFKQARRSFEAALDIQRSSLAHDPENEANKYATATTLCNLGYLYRYRDMHSMAADALHEALELQESVLGQTNATVLSTLDNIADSCANGGSFEKALGYYQDVLRRFDSGPYQSGPKTARAKSVLLYKMSRVYRKQNNATGQLDHLKMALRFLRSQNDAQRDSGTIDSLERQILYDMRACREHLEKHAGADRV